MLNDWPVWGPFLFLHLVPRGLRGWPDSRPRSPFGRFQFSASVGCGKLQSSLEQHHRSGQKYTEKYHTHFMRMGENSTSHCSCPPYNTIIKSKNSDTVSVHLNLRIWEKRYRILGLWEVSWRATFSVNISVFSGDTFYNNYANVFVFC